MQRGRTCLAGPPIPRVARIALLRVARIALLDTLRARHINREHSAEHSAAMSLLRVAALLDNHCTQAEPAAPPPPAAAA